MALRSVSAALVVAGCSALALGLAGCGSGSEPTTPGTPATGPAPSSAVPTTGAARSTAAAAPKTSAAPSASVRSATKPLLVLEPDGLGVLSGTSIRHLPFGTDILTLTRALETTLGPVSRSSMAECGQGARVQLAGQGFSALFNGVGFVGWHDSGRVTPHLTTAAGVGVGSTLASVRSVLADVEVTTDSLGPEWTSGAQGLGGLLDGTAATSKVTQIYAGETCFFR